MRILTPQKVGGPGPPWPPRFRRLCITYVPDITYLKQDVDGETLLMLSTTGSIDQLVACGFKTVKQQMTLRKLLASCSSSSMVMSSMAAGSSSASTASISSGSPSPQPSRKLTKQELNSLSPQARQKCVSDDVSCLSFSDVCQLICALSKTYMYTNLLLHIIYKEREGGKSCKAYLAWK